MSSNVSDYDRDVENESDIEDDDLDSLRGDGSDSVSKRAHQNSLERRRRYLMKNSFSTLRRCIPAVPGKKYSRSEVLENACGIITALKKRLEIYQKDLAFLNHQNVVLVQQIEEIKASEEANRLAGNGGEAQDDNLQGDEAVNSSEEEVENGKEEEVENGKEEEVENGKEEEVENGKEKVENGEEEEVENGEEEEVENGEEEEVENGEEEEVENGEEEEVENGEEEEVENGEEEEVENGEEEEVENGEEEEVENGEEEEVEYDEEEEVDEEESEEDPVLLNSQPKRKKQRRY